MKRRTRIIVFLVFLFVLFLGWTIGRNKLEDKMCEALTARYPTDSFTVRDVSLTFIPPGAKGVAHAAHEKLDFTVSIYRNIGEEAVVVDDFYEARSREHYEGIFSERMKPLKNEIEGYALEMIVLGDQSRDPETGYYHAAAEIMLRRDVKGAEAFLSEVKSLAETFKKDPVKGVDAYIFRSFPGSVPESDLPDIGMSAAWLTAPSPTPTPSPTPRPTVLQSGQTLPETEKTTTAAVSSTTEEEGLRPAFSYELTILSDRFDLDEGHLRNSLRSVTYTTKELQKMAERLHLDEQAKRLMNRAPERQEGTGLEDSRFDAEIKETTAAK